MITIICPNLRCRSVLQVPEQIRGRTVRCGCCGKNFIVPAPDQRPALQRPQPAAEPDKVKN